MLYKGWLDTKALSELNQFVYDFLPNCLSLQVLAQPPDAAIELLLNNAPQAVISYAKVFGFESLRACIYNIVNTGNYSFKFHNLCYSIKKDSTKCTSLTCCYNLAIEQISIYFLYLKPGVL